MVYPTGRRHGTLPRRTLEILPAPPMLGLDDVLDPDHAERGREEVAADTPQPVARPSAHSASTLKTEGRDCEESSTGRPRRDSTRSGSGLPHGWGSRRSVAAQIDVAPFVHLRSHVRQPILHNLAVDEV